MNILLFNRNSFAQRNLNAHSRRVANAGGIIQDGDAIARRYELYGKLGIFPRRDYSALGGVLLNGQSVTNLLLWSNDFTQTVWTKTDVTVTANAIANPVNGTVDADLITEGSAGTAVTLQSYTVSAGATICQSLYIKRQANLSWCLLGVADSTGTNGAGFYFNIQTGVKGSSSISGTATAINFNINSIGDGWYRIDISGNAPTFTTYRLTLRSASADLSTTRVANAQYYVYGAQAQTGTIATDPITSLSTQGVATQSFVQTLFDLNNTSPVDAIQSTAANQPYWGLDPDTGFRVPLFDGSNDFMSVNDLGIFNAQAAGTIVSVAKDLNRTGGDADHILVRILDGGGTRNRATLLTRRSGAQNFALSTVRVDASTSTIIDLTSLNGYNYLCGEFVWAGNLTQLTVNGTISPSFTYSSGAGSTSATNSVAFELGSVGGTTARMNGYIAELPIFRTALSAAQIAAFREFYKRNYRTLP